MQSIDLFLPHLQPWLMATPEPLAKAALVRAARDFCERTHVAQVTVGPLTATVGDPDFEFTLPADLELVLVKRAWWETDELGLVSRDDMGTPLAYTASVGTTTRQNGRPRQAFLSAPLTLSVLPPPDSATTNALTLRVAVRPAITATTFSDELYFDWLEAVIAKAALVLAGMPGGTMVDAALMATAQATYARQVAAASDVARRGRVQTALRVRGAPFA